MNESFLNLGNQW